MSVDESASPAERPDPGQQRVPGHAFMTEAEKRAAEWEARHDVAARGRRVPPDVLQHYLSHERLMESHPTEARPPRSPAAGSHPVGAGTTGTARPVPSSREVPGEATAPPRRWWHFSRRPGRGGDD